MGTLVFQATLGGQVNLTGPNTASTFTISVPAVTGTMITSGDTATVTSTMISGPVTTAKGGTGLTSFTSGGAVYATSTSALATGTLPSTAGGTGLTSFTSGGVVYASSSSALTTGSNLTYDGTNLGLNGGFLQVSIGGTQAIRVGSTDSIVGGTNNNGILQVGSSKALLFYAGGSEYARFDTSGNLLIGTTSADQANTRMQVNGGNTGTQMFVFKNTQGSGSAYVIQAVLSYSPNDATSRFMTCGDSTTDRIQLRSNGGIANYSANNVNLSDERTKTNIQNAGGYLAKICAIPVRTFKYKDQTDDLLNLGVIAQEVEAVAPELVDVTGFGETPEDGVPLKAIYQTDLQYALMKCIQEQQAIIESLKARLDAANL
jgi:hypothetical protein